MVGSGGLLVCECVCVCTWEDKWIQTQAAFIYQSSHRDVPWNVWLCPRNSTKDGNSFSNLRSTQSLKWSINHCCNWEQTSFFPQHSLYITFLLSLASAERETWMSWCKLLFTPSFQMWTTFFFLMSGVASVSWWSFPGPLSHVPSSPCPNDPSYSLKHSTLHLLKKKKKKG